MLKPFSMDLHIHTHVSPCAGREMTPQTVVNTARWRGLDIIAVTDHDSAAATAAVIRAARGTGLTVIPGIEVETAEEVHLLCLFPSLKAVKNSVREICPGSPRKALAQTARPEAAQVIADVGQLGGITFLAHLNRRHPNHRGLNGLPFDGIEFTANILDNDLEWQPELARINSSDAHYGWEIGRNPSTVLLEEPDFDEIKKALAQNEGRCLLNNEADFSLYLHDCQIDRQTMNDVLYPVPLNHPLVVGWTRRQLVNNVLVTIQSSL